jgi:hypothetical protein
MFKGNVLEAVELGAYSVWHETKGLSTQVEQVHAAEETHRTRIPRPMEDGSYDVESLGPIVDRLMGDRRVREKAAETIRILADDEPREEPAEAPVEIPTPVPGGITRVDDPPAKKR